MVIQRNSLITFCILTTALLLFVHLDTSGQGSNFKHLVKKGETLYGISRMYGVNIVDIKRTNLHLSGDQIAIGQVLKIPYAKVGSESKPVEPVYIVDNHDTPSYFVRGSSETLDESVAKMCFEEDVPQIAWESFIKQSRSDNQLYNYSSQCIIETNDGGFVVSGYRSIDIFSPVIMWLAKIDRLGGLIWEKTFGNGIINSVIQMNDGGYVLASSSLLIRTNQSGEKTWSKRLQNTNFRQVIRTADNGLVLLSDDFIFKRNSRGREMWKRQLGNEVEANSVVELKDGSFVIVGKQSSGGNDDIWVGKVDKGGNRLWRKTYGENKLDNAYSIVQLSDGNLALGGFSMQGKDKCNQQYCESSVYLVKINQDGKELWSSGYTNYLKKGRNYSKMHNTATHLLEMPNGHIMIAAKSSADDEKLWLIRADSNGNMVWNEEFEGMVGAVDPTSDGGFVLAGWKQDQQSGNDGAWMVKFEPDSDYQAPKERPAHSEVRPPRKKRKSEDNLPLVMNVPKSPPKPPMAVKNKPKKPTPKPKREKQTSSIVSVINQQPKSNVTPMVNKEMSDKPDKVTAPILTTSNKKDNVVGPIMPGILNPKQKNRNTNVVVANKGSRRTQRKPRASNPMLPPTIVGPVPDPSFTQPVVPKNYNVVTMPNDKPDLHILAIGTAPPDLEFAAKDAEDFASVFKDQGSYLGTGNKLFRRVNIKKLIGKKASTKAIESAIERLYFDYQQGTIHDNDLLVIYLSSHGFIHQNKFRIESSDFDYQSPKTTSVAYEDIVEYLTSVPCKKLIFIDACHSGSPNAKFAAKASVSAINYYIQQLSTGQQGVTTITSSGKNEQSYEDRRAKNGFFTKAILQAFKGKADANRDDVITVEELGHYLTKTVPKLVGDAIGKLQNPQILSNDLKHIPLYVVK